MQLYTVILEYEGGTYLKQLRSDDAASALRQWVDMLSREQTPLASAEELTQLCQDLAQDYPVPVAGMISVWCASAEVCNKLALIHLIQTQP